jgi:hypothetical protein
MLLVMVWMSHNIDQLVDVCLGSFSVKIIDGVVLIAIDHVALFRVLNQVSVVTFSKVCCSQRLSAN